VLQHQQQELRMRALATATSDDDDDDGREAPILTAPATAATSALCTMSGAQSPLVFVAPPGVSSSTGGVLAPSERIRRRIEAAAEAAGGGAKPRYFSNDNISQFIAGAAELMELEAEVASKFDAVLRSLVIDVDRDHNSHETARRVAKMYMREVFAGRYTPQPTVTSFPNVGGTEDLFVVGPIDVRSTCSHHLCPIRGKLWVGVLPCATSRLIGLSKFGRIAEWVAARPQIQEEAVSQMADALEAHVQPRGLVLYMDAEHGCMTARGVRHAGCSMGSMCARGVFKTDAAARQEFMAVVSRSGCGARLGTAGK
jgi:GTP cyclohydrolase I